MFCAQCGVRAAGGNFCTACGAKLVKPEPGPGVVSPDVPVPPDALVSSDVLDPTDVLEPVPAALHPSPVHPVAPATVPFGDWQNECRYEALMQYPQVRDLIARNAARAPSGLTGEKFLDLCDEAFSPIPGVSLKSVAGMAAGLYAQWGIETCKSRRDVLPTPIGRTIVSTLCSLARHGRSVKEVQQANDGCIVTAILPSDIWSFEGQVAITLTRVPHGTRAEAATKIPGQLYDWGKSNKCLTQLFDEIESIAA